MAMDLEQREEFRHKEWLGLLQPIGLVVSPKALMDAQASVPESLNAIELQQTLRELLADTPHIESFTEFALKILGWSASDLVSEEGELIRYEVNLREYQDILQPSFVVPDPDGDRPLMFVKELSIGQLFDVVDPELSQNEWQVSPQAKFERLLREKAIATGLLFNGMDVRLVYAPVGESSGYLTFSLSSMTEVAGRLLLGAMEMLLGVERVFEAPDNRRLTDILAASRKYQSEVSTELSKQVVDALWELLNGFQTADAAAKGSVLGDLPETDPQQIYGGLITTLLRLVFLLYAEDEGLMPGDEIYTQNYSVTGLFERLQQDLGNYPDTMDQRFGAWAWLLSLFRLVYDGGGDRPTYLPARRGELFDPSTYPFLEGSSLLSTSPTPHVPNLPRIPDGVIYRILNKLLILNGDRLSYRALDVEDIGSVYEAIMGFEIEKATGQSIGVWSKPNNSKILVTTVIDLEILLEIKAKERKKWLKDNAGCDITGKGLTALKTAKNIDDLLAALGNRISPHTPYSLAPHTVYLQPGEERRRTGSHYTPRAMTEPIVKETLRPILEQMGANPTPEQILNLKVCDVAMGSGAFLVQACRQLAEELVKAWELHDRLSEVPPEDEPLLYARRLIAQKCLYGVDRNPFAVQLAKLSLWLVTLAENHSFMFLDHALKCGDSLVGLTRGEIGSFTKKSNTPLMDMLAQNVTKAIAYRTKISNSKDDDYQKSKNILGEAEAALESPKLAGQLAVAAMFSETKKAKREDKLKEFANSYQLWQSGTNKKADLEKLYQDAIDLDKPLTIFHWELEFPEVFEQKNSGFDVIVGNPPFAGKNTLINGNPENYVEYLKELHPESHGNADVVAHFFRRSFNLLRQGGSMGLIATNTIAQGDTRQSGLRFICNHGGMIYNTQRRYKWPGLAAVVVSIIHIFKVKQ